MHLFIEACFAPKSSPPETSWQDISDDHYYIFASDFGVVRLRKRFAYPATFAYRSGTKLVFGYGNQGNGITTLRQTLDQIPEKKFYEEFLLCVADCQDQTVTIQRDAFSTVPLFVGHANDQLTLTNIFERTFKLQQGRATLNHEVLANLVMGEPQHTATLVRNIIVLHDRQRLEWGQKGAQISYPPHGGTFAQDSPSDPKDFIQRIDSTLQHYWTTYAKNNTVGTELSCGLDTSMINGFLARRNYPFKPVTLVYPDAYGKSLRSRLRTFADCFGVTSHQIHLNTTTDYPLANLHTANSWQPFFQAQDLYTLPLERAARYLAKQGAAVVFRGIGGDELMDNLPLLHAYEHVNSVDRTLASRRPPKFTAEQFARYCQTLPSSPTFPTPVLSASVAASAASGNNMYLSYNIWPVMPLADPELYAYCQGLPIRHRANRNIVRAYLQANQFPEIIYNPKLNEDFEDFFKKSVYNLDGPFRHFVTNSILAKHNLIDTRKALALWDGKQDVFELYCLLVAEINLQTLGFDTINT